jgi:mannose-1-phosphate guanylyltransferase
MKRYIVIMAGGVGSRFWPASTESRPKQFIDILGIGKSLLRLTFERSLQIVGPDEIIVVTHEQYKDLVLQDLPEMRPDNILCEPSRNNTAPCIAYAALHIAAKEGNAVFAVLPSDHVIMYEDVFSEKMIKAFDIAATEPAIVTLGISPTRPDTGYGYIRKGTQVQEEAYRVDSFKEKPNLATAETYLASGEYVWNAGIFIWSTNTIIGAFKKHAAQIIDTLAADSAVYNTNLEQAYINSVYPQTEKISIDYAILEKYEQVYTIPADIGWSDLGTWASLFDYMDKDNSGNVVQATTTVLDNVTNCIIKTSHSKDIIIKDLHNYIIVDEENALLIYPKDQEQEIKQAIQLLNK